MLHDSRKKYDTLITRDGGSCNPLFFTFDTTGREDLQRHYQGTTRSCKVELRVLRSHPNRYFLVIQSAYKTFLDIFCSDILHGIMFFFIAE